MAKTFLEPPTTIFHRPLGRTERFLRVVVWLYVPLGIVLSILVVTDDSALLGESVWIKPLKFAVSIGLNGAAFVWLLRRVRPTLLVHLAALASALALVAEQALITLQAARGVRSHFNMTSGFDSTIFSLMGAFVGVVWVATFVMAIAVSRGRIADPIIRYVAIAGTWLVLLGSSVGFLLVSANKHSVGGEDGGKILPLVGWNRDIGDLRPAHFVGLHGLQALIVAAWVAQRRVCSTAGTLRLLQAYAAAIGALCVGLAVQALSSQPVTSVSSVGLAAITVVIALIVSRRKNLDDPLPSAVAACPKETRR